MSAGLLSGGGKGGNHFIALFLDFDLDLGLSDGSCTGRELWRHSSAVRHSAVSRPRWMSPLSTAGSHCLPRWLRAQPDPEGNTELCGQCVPASVSPGLLFVCEGFINLIFYTHEYSAPRKCSVNRMSSLDYHCFSSQFPRGRCR